MLRTYAAINSKAAARPAGNWQPKKVRLRAEDSVSPVIPHGQSPMASIQTSNDDALVKPLPLRGSLVKFARQP